MMMPSRRVISGLVFAGLIAALIIWGENYLVAAVTAVIALALATEWSALTDEHDKMRQMPQIILTAVLMFAIYMTPEWLPWLLIAAAAWWVPAFVLLVSYDGIKENEIRRAYLMFRLGMPLVIAVAWVSLVFLHQRNYWWLLYCIALISLSDIGAYYGGRRFGKTALFAKLSPGKTWAGLWSGIAVSLVFCLSVALTVLQTWVDVIHLMLLSVCMVQVGVVGDLFVSLIKRYAGVKDTGTLLPGHGGLLDRADSLLPSLPLFYAMMFM